MEESVHVAFDESNANFKRDSENNVDLEKLAINEEKKKDMHKCKRLKSLKRKFHKPTLNYPRRENMSKSSIQPNHW